MSGKLDHFMDSVGNWVLDVRFACPGAALLALAAGACAAAVLGIMLTR